MTEEIKEESNEKKSEKNKKISKQDKIFWTSLGVIALAFLIGGYFFYQHIVAGLPSLEQLENPQQSLATNVISADGKVIGQFFRQNRREVNIDSIPHFVVEALVATEDRKFYDHWGVDLKRFMQAMVKTIFLGKKEGASTITQQLIKTTLLTREKSIPRSLSHLAYCSGKSLPTFDITDTLEFRANAANDT